MDQSTLDSALGTSFGGDLQANRTRLAGAQASRAALDAPLADASGQVAKIEGQTATDEQAARAAIANQVPRTSAQTPSVAPEPPKPAIKPEDVQKTAGMMMVVAGLMGAFSRGGWTSALKSMAGAMKGFQEGNAEQAKQHLDQYKTQVEDFRTKLEAFKADRDALDKLDQRDLQGLRQQLELTAHAHDAELVAAKAKVSSYTDARKELDKQIDQMQKAVDHAQTTEEGMRRTLVEHNYRLQEKAAPEGGAAAAGGLTPAGLKVQEELVRAGKPVPKGKRGEVDVRLLNAMGVDEAGGAGSGSITADQASYKADAGSLALQQKRLDGIDAGMRKIANDIKTIDSTIAEGNAGFAQWLNRPLNELRTKSSDPKLAAYALSVKQVATEYERLLQGGQLSTAQLHQGAAEEAKKILSEDMSVGEVRAVIPVMLREMDNARNAANDQLHDIRERLHKAPPAPADPAAPFADPEKEKRYQLWKSSHAGG